MAASRLDGENHGYHRGPFGIRLTPMMRHQPGDQIGRIIQHGFSYGTQNVLIEPLNSNRMDNITIWDLRAEKVFRFGVRSVSGFMNLYNITNSTPSSASCGAQARRSVTDDKHPAAHRPLRRETGLVDSREFGGPHRPWDSPAAASLRPAALSAPGK